MLASVRAFRILSVATLVYSLAVILWGAFVRATGSGAGCGAHWPLCNGEVLPRAPALETVIELTHRLTSGLLLPLMAVTLVAAFRAFGKGHPARWTTVWAAIFLVIESLVGAGIVLLEYTADNLSIARGYWMGAHQANTFVMLGWMTLSAWHGWSGARVRLRGPQSAEAWRFGLAALLLLAAGISGAVAALGNTLFPAESLIEGFRMDAAQESHPLIRLRVFHPVLAALAAVWSLYLSMHYAQAARDPVRRFATALAALLVFQVMAGILNLLLLAPVALQLTHLLLADAVVIVTVLLGAAALSPSTDPRALRRDG
jgi:cytochrome c oxidase assembly protein subunit 15